LESHTPSPTPSPRSSRTHSDDSPSQSPSASLSNAPSTTECRCGALIPRSLCRIANHQALCRFNTESCHKCLEIFPSRCALFKHLEEAHSFIPHAVLRSMCNTTKTTRKRVRKCVSLKPVANPQSPLVCAVDGCGRVFESVKRLHEHALTHSRPFKCSLCFRRFGKRWNLREHHRTHLPVRGETVWGKMQCRFCSQSFATRSLLRRHMKEHAESGPPVLRPFSCRRCGKAFVTKNGLQTHLGRCGRDKGRIPMGSQRDSKERRFVCHHVGCGRAFAQKSDLKRHDIVHSKLKPFGCSICLKRFGQRGDLYRHIRAKHGVEHPQQCVVLEESCTA